MVDRIITYLKVHRVAVLLFAAFLLFVLSFATPGYYRQLQRQVHRATSSLHARQRLMERYAIEALSPDGSDDGCVEFGDMPEDMVMYMYRNDTLQYWVNEFPISNDGVDVQSFSYHLQYLSNSNLYGAPLAYVGVRESYVNLGSAWYVINTQLSEDLRSKVVTGIRIKTEYTSDNISGTVNPKLHLGRGFTTEAVMVDDGAIVYGREGGALFSIVPDSPSAIKMMSDGYRWLALLCVVVAVSVYHSLKRRWSSFAVSSAALLLSRIAAEALSASQGTDMELFSPMLYAGSSMVDSLGCLLLNSLFISLFVFLLFDMRVDIVRRYNRDTSGRGRWIPYFAALAAAALLSYIHISLSSLIINSNIVLEPYRIDLVSIYTLLCYISTALLFLALLFLLQIFVSLVRGKRRISLFYWKNIAVYSIVAAIYCVSVEAVYGFGKEYETNRVNTAKLAIERDLSLELQLRSVEEGIARDPFIAALSQVHGLELIQKRLVDRYLYKDLLQKYNVRITTCTPEDYLTLGGGALPVGCYDFYRDQLKDYGVPLSPDSDFYYLNNYNGVASYIGAFTFVSSRDYSVSRLFIELEAKYAKDPFDIWNLNNNGNVLKPYYSYARYLGGRLVRNDGTYNYSSVVPSDCPEGYTKTYRNGYTHFINNMGADDVTIISRPRRPFFPYLISFSYIAIFFGLFLAFFTRGGRSTRMFTLPRYSLRRKISYVTTGIVCFSLLSIGAAMMAYTIKSWNKANDDQMEHTISLVQESLAKHCRYAMRYNELNTPEFYNAMDLTSDIAGVDINVYDTYGSLIRSTNPDIYDQFIVGNRMDNEAFHEIVHLRSLRYTGIETAANLSFYSLYAPLFNADGVLVAIINVPYMTRSADIKEATASTASMILDLYLLLFLAAVITGRVVSNWMLRPLAEIKLKMDTLATSQGGDRHIIYRNARDEIGVLVSSYNKMVDDLDRSTRQLAQNERTQAWMDMAGKIAHDIKNPLTPMRLSIQYLMKLKAGGVEGWQERFDRMSVSLLEQIDILSDAASQFSSMASSETPVLVNVNSLIMEILQIFDSNRVIRFEFVPLDGQIEVVTCRKKINRALVNLITNSVQAIEALQSSENDENDENDGKCGNGENGGNGDNWENGKNGDGAVANTSVGGGAYVSAGADAKTNVGGGAYVSAGANTGANVGVDANNNADAVAYAGVNNNANAGAGESGHRGRVRITASKCCDEGVAFCRIDVEDDGNGVPREYLDRLFTSSFTSKSSGSGLGLINCKIVVEQAHGTITYSRSTNLGGACFTIRLPM